MTDKAALRAAALAARAEQGGDAAVAVARLRAALAPHAGQVLAGYWPMRAEADPLPAMAAHDGPLCLPVVPGRDVPLIFRAWAPGAALDAGPFGTRHPPESAPVLVPQVLIVPLAAFDRAGQRIGYGGGFYDRTLAQLRAAGPVTAIGFAFACQQVAAVPVGPFDQPLDLIVTDRDTIHP
ncbi:MAG: 5-formyltetrahydrofolate cyclo-ligase [Paracoccus sp. (in: a-proteobacteria)]|uniref:5-formyltetrahydrofolate cyclo-ligase n=1 Tax=Paracoccus sp. TaxID=267 RepID=UPI0026E001C6|nr:5-formyltetrahydrofolate cyclo-ligase [Paracoccus sp. (in: a-proteobacteria)]MDO5613072.1 5-formyltetrahydrofolate cyclo-ligase [Paracoccus sp. (in: a-proteobacteria)]